MCRGVDFGILIWFSLLKPISYSPSRRSLEARRKTFLDREISRTFQSEGFFLSIHSVTRFSVSYHSSSWLISSPQTLSFADDGLKHLQPSWNREVNRLNRDVLLLSLVKDHLSENNIPRWNRFLARDSGESYALLLLLRDSIEPHTVPCAWCVFSSRWNINDVMKSEKKRLKRD